MRQSWTRAARPRRLIVAAAIVVVTMAASSPSYSEVGRSGLSPSAVLLSVSCSSAEMCIAVGTGPDNQALAEKWDGKMWKVVRTAHPVGATDSNFYAVSCSSSHTCMAVGGYDTKSHPHGRLPLAELWNGQSWRVKATPRPGTYSSLDGVSCPSANRCMAVGFVIRRSANNAFSEAWNGRRWLSEPTPRPRGTTYSSLDGVSCAAANVCMAVGSYQAGTSHSLTLSESWNGQRWTRRATPNPVSGANGSDLNAVSCRSVNACVAVGVFANAANSGGLTLAETWNGKTWALSASGNAGSAASALESVSCISTSVCVAVGGSFAIASNGSTLAQRWAGGKWTVETTPNPNGATQGDLTSVSCRSQSACVAVGTYFTNSGQGGFPLPVTEVWNGASWTIVASAL